MDQPVTGSGHDRNPANHSSDLSWEETYDGAWAVAAPRLDGESRALAAFGVATPISRHSPAVEASNRDAVIDAATRASSSLRLDQRREQA
jgi:DNA-binding IclR family transcriptional regulator